MKILFLSEFFPPYFHGGGEVSMLELARQLNYQGHSIIVLTPKYGPEISKEKGINVITYPFYRSLKQPSDTLTNIWFANPVFLTYLTLLIIFHCSKDKVQLIHVHSRFSIPSAVIAGKIMKIPVIATIRDWQILCNYAACISYNSNGKTCSLFQYFTKDFPQYYKEKVLNKNLLIFLLQMCFAIYGRCQRNFLNFFSHYLDNIVCISHFQQEIFRTNSFDKTVLIYNPQIFGDLARPLKTKNLILYQGRITDGKGIGVLLKAFSRIVKTNPTYKLILAGHGQMEKYQQLATKLQITDKVNFLGWLSKDDLNILYKHVRLIVLPSITPEPFGRGALEALSHGIPVIGSSRGAMNEIVEDNVTGLITLPAVDELTAAIEKGIKLNSQFRLNIKKHWKQIREKFEVNPINSYVMLYKKYI